MGKLLYDYMAKRKFDYDGDEFYEEIFALAMAGASDADIAESLAERFGTGLSPDVFGAMKNGYYHGWNKSQNEKYGGRICRVLMRARTKINLAVRSKYLKMALGGLKTKNVTTERRKLKINGVVTEDEEIRTTETEFELAPNMQALATWLYHHDPEWRKLQQGKEDNEEIPEANAGVEIGKWIEKENEGNDKNP